LVRRAWTARKLARLTQKGFVSNQVNAIGGATMPAFQQDIEPEPDDRQ
jgi:hypothetical protein